ncbi:unnamed protein product, partial [Porites lobata]
SCGRKRSHYDKEMDHAFTLIFHNIKRLQDGHLSNSTTTLEQAEGKSEITTCTNTMEVPLRRERSRSDTSLLRYTGDMRTLIELQSNMTRPKSRSHCGEVACPAETRKVRFSDDYVTRKEDVRRPPLTKRPWSDQPPRPAIDVVPAMRDFKPTKDMSHHPSRKHSNRYDKEMDQAFTLIFHNIKRLQDGMLSNSDPDLTKEPSNFDLEPKTVKTIQKPVRKRSRSEDFRILGFGVQRTASPALIKSGSLQQLSDAAKSPFQRRKVRFADD